MVECVTDAEGDTRSERKLRTYLKIKKNQNAIIVKLADRIANVEACILDNNLKKLEMYQSEHTVFKKELDLHVKADDGKAMFKYPNYLIENLTSVNY